MTAPGWRTALLALILLGCSQSATLASDVFEANRLLGPGINFGNALEAPKEGDWGMVLEPEFFDLVKQAGFNHIRLPVSWTYHAEKIPPYTIDPKFFARVDWALEQATQRGLRIVLNVHHYDELNADPVGEEARALAIWRQIAEHYKNQPNLVYFEVLNEPHGTFNENPQLWNAYLAKAIAVIRQSNPARPVVVGPVGWNSIRKLPDLKLPNDPNLIVTVHFYEPLAFTHQGAEWVQPALPVGTAWTGTQPSWAWSWTDRSWDSGVSFGPTGGLEVTYNKGWAGLYLHSDPGVEGYTTLAFRTDRAVSLSLSCNRVKSKALTAPANLETVFSFSDCGSPPRLHDLILQNNTPQPQPTYTLSGLELRGPGKVLPLVTNEAGAIQGAFAFAADWAKTNHRPLYVGEFGSYGKAELDSRVRWTTAVRAEAERQGFSWAYWEFGAGFGIYDRAARSWRMPLLNALIP